MLESSLGELLESVRRIANEAGGAALGFYGREGPVELKADQSPLTLADKASHRLIVDALSTLTPDIPVVSEESDEASAIRRDAAEWLWLVDPLDGTKEFLKRTGEFTVNIGLVHEGYPVLGVVHVPVTGESYLGLGGGSTRGAWWERADGGRQAVRTRAADPDRLTIVASRDHAGPVVEAFLQRVANAEVASMGSSLKFCLVASGRADFYPRVVPTMQWDTAGAQAILEAAGGHLTDLEGRRLAYRADQLRNPSTLAFGDPRIDWPRFFAGYAAGSSPQSPGLT
jgi:3'(2'), 5'-bisphosphate nucleotidase